MANSFLALPAPASNSSGAAVDVSALGAAKTIVVRGNGTLFEPYVLIEYSNDAAGLIWTPVVQFTKPGVQSVQVACRYLRATVRNYSQGGAPKVSVGAAAGVVAFVELIAPVANGEGDAADTSAEPGFKTIQLTGVYKGVANIEVSDDAGVSYATIASFQQGVPQTWSGIVYANRMRISRSGITAANPGLPICNIGSADVVAGGGGGGTISVSDQVLAKGDGAGNLVDSRISDDGATDIEVVARGLFVDSGTGENRLRLAASGAVVNWIQSGVDGTAGSALPLKFGTMGGAASWFEFDAAGNVTAKGNATLEHDLTVGLPTTLDATMNFWGHGNFGRFVGNTIASGNYCVTVTDYSPQAQGTGGSLKFDGPRTNAGDIIGGAEIKAWKSNGVDGTVGHDLVLATKTQGGVGLDIRFAIRQVGVEVRNTVGATAIIEVGAGSPEGVVTAPVGSLYMRTDGGVGTSLYVKEAGAGNVGWAAK